MTRTVYTFIVVLGAAVMLGSAGCAQQQPSATGVASKPAGVGIDGAPDADAPLPARPGDIVGYTNSITGRYPDIDAVAAQSVAASYRSTSGVDDAATVVSGTFFVPRGTAPADGWPVVALAHATIGLSNGCGPSMRPDLGGYTGEVVALLNRGFAVALTDYQGLGRSGVHPYLEPVTAAHNVIDSVRALRRIDNSVSAQWAGWGASQGGQAIWAATELADEYGSDLHMVGGVAQAPVSDLTAMVDGAAKGTLTAGQRVLYPMVVVGAARSAPSVVDEGELLRVSPETSHDILGCENAARIRAVGRTGARGPVALDDRDRIMVTKILQHNALPMRRAVAPLLVVNGTEDPLIDADWTRRAVEKACDAGDTVVHNEIRGKHHDDLGVDDASIQWIADRFAGRRVTSSCTAGGR